MKIICSIIALSLIILSCRSTERSVDEPDDIDIVDIPNLLTPQAPDSTDILKQHAYVDHIEMIFVRNIPKILIQGHLPNPCCNLDTVEEIIRDNKIHLTLNAWQPVDAICIQVLQPFSFLQPLPAGIEHDDVSEVFINGALYEL